MQNEKDLPTNNFKRKYVTGFGWNIYCWVVFHITGTYENVKLKPILVQAGLVKIFLSTQKCKI